MEDNEDLTPVEEVAVVEEAKKTAKKKKETATESVDMAALKAEMMAELKAELQTQAGTDSYEQMRAKVKAELEAEAKAKEKKTAKSLSRKREEAAKAAKADLVPLELIYDADKYADDVFVQVAGMGSYQIQRGVPVMVPRCVRDVILNGMAQDKATAVMVNGLQRKFESKSKRYGA